MSPAAIMRWTVQVMLDFPKSKKARKCNVTAGVTDQYSNLPERTPLKDGDCAQCRKRQADG